MMLDVVGCLSYVLPIGGELLDVVWAPLSAIVFYSMFGLWRGSLVVMLEEALPFTDFIPTFTIAWLLNEINQQQKKGELKTNDKNKIEI
jgi:hypothetical protein